MNNLAVRVANYMRHKKYLLFAGVGYYNIIYVEGMNANGTLNSDAPNCFNDRRLLLEVVGGIPQIIGNWEATTEPGSHYTYSPMNKAGAARIKFGQYTAWRVGMHGTSDRHEALVQVREVCVHRDFNKDFIRTGDRITTGLYGINQHWGYDLGIDNIGTASAGCLVGRSRGGHREFMNLIKQDVRCRKDPSFIFTSSIIPGDELSQLFPGDSFQDVCDRQTIYFAHQIKGRAKVTFTHRLGNIKTKAWRSKEFSCHKRGCLSFNLLANATFHAFFLQTVL